MEAREKETVENRRRDSVKEEELEIEERKSDTQSERKKG